MTIPVLILAAIQQATAYLVAVVVEAFDSIGVDLSPQAAAMISVGSQVAVAILVGVLSQVPANYVSVILVLAVALLNFFGVKEARARVRASKKQLKMLGLLK
jgi:hypothetical protein